MVTSQYHVVNGRGVCVCGVWVWVCVHMVSPATQLQSCRHVCIDGCTCVCARHPFAWVPGEMKDVFV